MLYTLHAPHPRRLGSPMPWLACPAMAAQTECGTKPQTTWQGAKETSTKRVLSIPVRVHSPACQVFNRKTWIFSLEVSLELPLLLILMILMNSTSVTIDPTGFTLKPCRWLPALTVPIITKHTVAGMLHFKEPHPLETRLKAAESPKSCRTLTWSIFLWLILPVSPETNLPVNLASQIWLGVCVYIYIYLQYMCSTCVYVDTRRFHTIT